MIQEIFTVEEENLICVFDISSRYALIKGILAAMPEFDEPEMSEIAESILRKLHVMTESEFSSLIISPAYITDESEV